MALLNGNVDFRQVLQPAANGYRQRDIYRIRLARSVSFVN
jgi:hypothetical protein